jgi:Icc-related predicted phosphoesterase
MKLLIFSDIHSDVRALEKLMAVEADYYIAAGDLVTWARGLEKVGPVMERRAAQTYVLPGNHESEADIDRFCAQYGFQPFHGRSFSVNGTTVAGLGYSSPTPFNTPGEYSEEEIARRLQPFADQKPLVLVCHCPPKNTPLDRIREGLHAGSRSVAEFIEKQQPTHFFCGHIHEAEGVSIEIGATKALNVGKRGFLLEI